MWWVLLAAEHCPGQAEAWWCGLCDVVVRTLDLNFCSVACELYDNLELAQALPVQCPAGGLVSGSETPGPPWFFWVQRSQVPDLQRWGNYLMGACVCKVEGQVFNPKSGVGLELGRESFHFLLGGPGGRET